MEEQQRLELFKYLIQEDEKPNPIKLQYLEKEEEYEQEQEKENQHNKVINDSTNIFSAITEKSLSQCQEVEHTDTNNIENDNNSSIGDSRSFYRENGVLNELEQYEKHEQQLKELAKSSQNSSNSNNNSNQIREMQLQEWLEMKKGKNSNTSKQCITPNRTPFGKSISANNNNHFTPNSMLNSAEKSVYVSGAELAMKYFSERTGYSADGKGSTSKHGSSTKPKSPKFETAQRSQIHALKLKQITEEQKSSENKSSIKKIDPKNFILQTELRARSRPQTPIKEEDEEFCFKARPMPEFKEFSIQKFDQPHTEFKQFALTTEQRGRKKEQSLKVKLENEQKILESSRQFKALDIPEYQEITHQHNNTNKSIHSPKQTAAKRFLFETEKRAAKNTSIISPYSQSADKYQFKAKKMPDFTRMQALKKPSPRKTTIPVKVVLQSTVRAEERKIFEQEIQEKNEKEFETSRVIGQKELSKEEQEREELRKATIFKAHPIKKYKPIEVHKSDQHLTRPESPKFHTDQRLRSTEKSQQLH